jgi:hypothetical protein
VDRHEKDDLPKVDDAENALLKLARKQGMNTDVRRSIFVVLMGSEVSKPNVLTGIVNL